MHRLIELKNEIDFHLDDAGCEEKSIAIGHLYGVSELCVLLALRRGADTVICAACGLLHDLWTYKKGDSSNHAHHSAKLAVQILEDIRLFEDYEIKTISEAIKNHSNKGEEHDIYSEILKDADVLHHYILNPEMKFTRSKAQRIKTSMRELGINIKVKKK
jgi:uncharacterized protein